MLWLLWLTVAGASSTQDTLANALDQAMEVFSEEEDSPHYIALTVTDEEEVTVVGRLGTLAHSDTQRRRHLDVDLRAGTPELDSSRPLRGFSSMSRDGRNTLRIPLDSGYPLEHALWQELDARFRGAREHLVMLRGNQQVKVEEERIAPDFSPRAQGEVAQIEVPALTLDIPAWEDRVVRLSELLETSDEVHYSRVQLGATRQVKDFVDTEGGALIHGGVHARLMMHVQTVAEDGDQVDVSVRKDVHDPARIPDDETLAQWASEAVEHLLALRHAPRGEPYNGPVLLEGRAAAVFFHEVLGHRVESHRQKREDEGRTFADHVGRAILPSYIQVYDDPTVAHLHGEDLNGHYLYDDEGVAARRADLVKDGVFVGFLTSRSPISQDDTSNGHGRRASGNPPVSRMGNTIIETDRPTPSAELRRQLIAEAKRQDLEYAYIVSDIDGGFTMTGRTMPNAFNVRANTVWRVFTDGRPDMLVRGLDLVGTPFVAFSNLIAAGDDPQVFNGSCGAESGWVPVSGIAPSLLFSRLEFQLKEKAQERPPLLDKPTPGGGSAWVPLEPPNERLAGGAR